MRRLSDEEGERKRLERNEAKRERRQKLREVERFMQTGGADSNGKGFGAQIEALVAKIAERTSPRFDENAIASIIDERIKSVKPDRFIVEIEKVEREIEGRAHRLFEPLLRICKARNRNGHAPNVLLVGPAGCGKSYAAKQVAKALDVPYGFISLSAGISESHLIGRYIPSGENGKFEYQEAPFVTFYREGGVFCLDELDAADENVLLVVNGALANGQMRLPDGTSVDRHPDFICIGCANTFGNGADRQYVGRNQLDSATLDRFVAARLVFDYDLELERTSAREDLCSWSQSVRDVRGSP